MKLTRKQRERVVELLRLGAEWVTLHPEAPHVALSMAEDFTDSITAPEASILTFGDARRAELSVDDTAGHEWESERFVTLLEAAARVEEGSWP